MPQDINTYDLIEHEPIFNFEKPFGTGYIKKFELTEGLKLYIWNCVLEEELTVPYSNLEQEKTRAYSLIYYLSPEAFFLQDVNSLEIKVNKLWNTTFSSGDLNKSFTIIPTMPAKFIEIRFTKNWVDIQSDETNDFFNRKNGEAPDFAKPVFFFETYNFFEKKMIDEINTSNCSQANPFFLKSRVIAIVKEFVSKVSERDFSITPTTNHGFEISKIENRLSASVKETLPSVKELSLEFCMSESTLKREFKKITGQSISQYFLRKKMDYAYKLFREKRGNVSEIACVLGYEKVSRFIEMFKKHHGISPGALLKSI